MDVGSAKVEITGDVSRFAAEVNRELNRILAGIRVPPVEVDGDFGRAVGQADTAAKDISGSFAAGADRSEDALAGVDEDFQEPRQAAAEASDSIASDFESAGSRAGAAISSFAVAAGTLLADVIKTVSSAVTDLGRSFIRGGWDRLAAIDRAEAKLRGLGHSADEVKSIMDDALASVRGTAFGLDAAAGVAARAVAAGVQPGEDLRRTLTAVADAAHIAGTGLDDVGEIVAQVATRGRATLDEFNRLEDRGIPILSYLAEQYGVTADAARDMVSRGKVDFETFRKLIEDNLGGAATDGASAVTAAWENVGFAFHRISANLQHGVFPQLLEVFEGIIDWLEPIEKAAENVGAALGEAFRVLRETGSIKDALAVFREELDPDLIGAATSAIRDLVTSGLQFLRDNIGDLIGSALEMRAVVFDTILGVIENIAAALPELTPQVVGAIVSMVTGIVTTLVNAAPAILQGAIDLVTGLVDGLLSALPMVLDGAVSIIETILTVLVQALPDLITAGIDLLVGIVTGIISALPQLQAAILGLIPVIIVAVIQILPQLQTLGIQLLLALVDGFVRALPDMMETVRTEVIPAFMEAVRTEFPAALAQGVEFLQQFVVGMAGAVQEIATVVSEEVVPAFTEMLEDNPEVIDAGIGVIMTLVQAMVDNIEMMTAFITETMIPLMTTVLEENLPQIIDAGIQILEAVVQGLIQAMPQINQAIVGQIIPAMFQALITAIPAMNRAGTQLIGALISSLWNTWRTKSGENLNRIKNAVINFFRNAGQWLRDAGRRVIDGLIGGIRSKFDDVRNTLGNLTSMLPDWKGPAQVDRAILRDAGRQVMEGFQAGIQDERGNVERLLRGITSDIGSIGAFTGRVQGGNGASAPRIPSIGEIHVHVSGVTGEEAGRRAAEAILEQLAQTVMVR